MALKSTCPTLAKIAHDEPMFVLRAQDTSAPDMVRHWARLALELGAPVAKVNEAYECAIAMETWQLKHSCKVPD